MSTKKYALLAVLSIIIVIFCAILANHYDNRIVRKCEAEGGSYVETARGGYGFCVVDGKIS